MHTKNRFQLPHWGVKENDLVEGKLIFTTVPGVQLYSYSNNTMFYIYLVLAAVASVIMHAFEELRSVSRDLLAAFPSDMRSSTAHSHRPRNPRLHSEPRLTACVHSFR